MKMRCTEHFVAWLWTLNHMLFYDRLITFTYVLLLHLNILLAFKVLLMYDC